MLEVINKDYELNFKIFEKKYLIKYSQMSMYDCIQFNNDMTKAEFDIYQWVEDFIRDWWATVEQEDFRCIDINLMLETIFDTYMKWFYEKKKWWWGKPYPFEAYIALLSKELNLDPTRLLKEYNPEQIKYYSEWIMYNGNEQTKEGQKRNSMNTARKEMNKEHTAEEALQIARDMEARLKSKTK